MDLLSVIGRWALRDKVSIYATSRRTTLSRNTTGKYLRAESVEPTFKVPSRPSKFDRLADKPPDWLHVEAGDLRKRKCYIKQLYIGLIKLGYDGSYSRVTPSSSIGARVLQSWQVSAPSYRSPTSICGTVAPSSCMPIRSRHMRCRSTPNSTPSGPSVV